MAKTIETYSYNKTTDAYTLILGGGVKVPMLTESLVNSRGYLMNLRVKYENQFNDHHISTFVAAEQSEGIIIIFPHIEQIMYRLTLINCLPEA